MLRTMRVTMTRSTLLAAKNVLRVLEKRSRTAKNELAGKLDAGDDVLRYLAHEGAPATRRAVAANLATPAQTNRLLAEDDDEDVRAELARKIARLMPGLSAQELESVRSLTIETFERLAADQVPRVRAVLAEEIKLLDCVPHATVVKLAHDLEAMVCVPILEYSPMLSDADLIEIIAEGKVHDALSAIARRRPLSDTISDAITSSLDISAVATLLANPHAAIREKTLETIVEQAEAVSALQECLVLRADLSRRAVTRLAGFVGHEMISALAQHYPLEEFVQSELRRRIRARLDEDGGPRASAADLAKQEVEAAAIAGKLDETFVEGAAESGRRETVIQALAKLCGVADDIVRRILLTRSAKPAVALAWRARLSMRAAFKIQRFVMKLPAKDLLPARDGVRFPLSEDEMRWHLNYFGLPE